MLPPPQALRTSNPASARVVPPTEIFTGLPPLPCGCKDDAIVKSKHSSQLAPWFGTRFSTVEDVCHYISAGIGPFYLQISLKSLTTGRRSCLTREALSREAQEPSTTPDSRPVRKFKTAAIVRTGQGLSNLDCGRSRSAKRTQGKEKFVNHIGRCTVELPALVS